MKNQRRRTPGSRRKSIDVRPPFEEEKYRRLVESVREYAIFMLDPRGRILTWNLGAQRLSAYSFDDVFEKPVSCLHLSEDIAVGNPERLLESAVKNGWAEEEGWRRRRDGSRFWAHAAVTALYHSDGSLRGFSNVIRDLTEWKFSQDAKRADVERFRLAVESLREYAILMLDSKGLVTSWNLGAERLEGYAAHEIVGQHFSSFFPREDILAGRVERALARAEADVSFEEDGWLVRKDGSRFWANVVLTALHDAEGAPRDFSLLIRDTTDSKLSQEALRSSEERFRSLFENANDIIYTHDLSGNFTGMNPAGERALGYPLHEIVNMNLVNVLAPEYLEPVFKWIHNLGGSFDSPVYEVKAITQDGHRLTLEVNAQIFLVDGAPAGVQGIARDITERKAAEEKMQKLNSEFKRQLSELETLNKELEMFSYSVSHDLRAPLRSIDGFSRELLERHADQLDDEGKDYLRRVRTSTQRMGHLIDDLLKLSRITSKEMNWEMVDLSTLAAEALATLQAVEPQRKVETVIADYAHAKGDRHLLQVVLHNLLENAWKFSSKQSEARIEFGVISLENGRRFFFVRDNGAGFDMQYAHKLFGPFQRLHSVDEFPGAGIGLAMVQRIIRRHGGHVWAQGAVGRGATFYFSLGGTVAPARLPQPEASATAAEEFILDADAPPDSLGLPVRLKNWTPPS